ncbi:ABC transporter substrate-binding protein [Microbacterium sp. DT81.1]|uniref:ABC transporter substrate-binding protein n=1 Tax=Microbacterium sp. DT81.1 TaxID=3393413 RepID=UPI003CF8DC98
MYRISKRAAAIFATAAISGLALAGCSAGTQSGSGEDGDTVLTMSGWADDGIAEALIAQFEKDNPGVTIDYTGLPWPGILTQINTELVSGTASDIVVVFPGNGNPITAQTLAKGNYLEDLSDSPWVSNYNDANQSVMGADGKILMGANAFTIIPAIYNTQALEEVGATAPTTWSEVLELCATAKDAGKVAYALAAVAGGNYHTVPFALTASLLYGPDPDFVDEQYAGDATFSDSEWTTALAQYRELVDAGCFTEDATGTALDIAQGQVADGEAIGIITVSPQINTIQEMAPEGTTFQTAAFPATDDPSETVLPVGLGAGYGVNAKSKNIDLAKKFVDLYLSEEGLKIAVENNPGIFPSGPVEGYTPPETLAGVAEQAQSDLTVAFPDQTWPNAVVNDTYISGLQAFIGGQSSSAELLEQMDAAWNG